MRKTFLYTLGTQGAQEPNQLEEAIIASKRGDKVLYVNCDGALGSCMINPHFNKTYCKACVKIQKGNNKKYLPKEVEQHFASYYINDTIIEIADNVKFEYSNLLELKSITYKNVNIGFGAVSSYVSLTRNLNPKMNTNFKRYINSLLRLEVILTEIGEQIIKSFEPNLMIVYNGRFAEYKPIVNLAQNYTIDFICTENMRLFNNKIVKNYYYNKTPHSILGNTEKYNDFWENNIDKYNDSESIAHSFYERRRNSLKTDDKVYTQKQNTGELPKEWNSKKENISIFNSSEDEFFATSHEFDESRIFPSQLEGIKEIAEHYIENEKIHFYVRVHPNMAKLHYKYHTDLFKLKYKNLTIISANSSVSSYSLIDASDKVIVFASTIGIEATYWGKPVICLSGTFYRDLDIAYQPKNKSELWPLISKKNLKCKYNDNVLKYGYFYMTESHDQYTYVDYEYIYYKIGWKKIQLPKHLSMLGSNILFNLYLYVVDKIIKKYEITSKFKHLPNDEE